MCNNTYGLEVTAFEEEGMTLSNEEEGLATSNEIGSRAWPIEFVGHEWHGQGGPTIILICGTLTFFTVYKHKEIPPINSLVAP